MADVSYEAFFQFLRIRGHKIRVGPRTFEEAEREYKKIYERIAG